MSDLAVDYKELDGFQFGKSIRLREWAEKKEAREFDKLVTRLRGRNWVRKVYSEGGDRLARLRRKNVLWTKTERGRLAKSRAEARRHQLLLEAYRLDPIVITCECCGTQWCPWLRGGLFPSVLPRFCSDACINTARYRRTRTKNAIVCGGCGDRGHNRRRCPTAAAQNTRAVMRRTLTDDWQPLEVFSVAGEVTRHRACVTLNALRLRGEAERRGLRLGAEWRRKSGRDLPLQHPEEGP